ncbi:hypothetical protein [Leptolyngbya ohadii]|uniref:hypothetical protein n=1 Tax=Leptolyngbya ohadii TaxID=1962290 RepID=UPI000B59EA07|nr:hypothetical protein [Leptolyngbya ohadii]
MQPDKTKSPIAGLNLSPAGALARRIQRLTLKQWMFGVLGVGGLATLAIGIHLMVTDAKPTRSSANNSIQQWILDAHPAVLAGVTDANGKPRGMSRYEALTKLYKTLPEFEQRLDRASQQHMNAMLTHEADRLLQQAQKEIAEGIEAQDAVIDMDACKQRLETQKCILLRYAGDGIRDIVVGDKAMDIYTTAKGYIRFKAAILALFPPPIDPDPQAPTIAYQNYRDAVMLLLQYLPQAEMGGSLPDGLASTNTAQNTKDENPID